MVEHGLADAGGAGVVHLDRGQQGRVGRQHEQGAHGGEGGDGRQRADTQCQGGRHQGLGGGTLRVEQHGGEEQHHGQQPAVLAQQIAGERLDLDHVALHEDVAQPGHAQHADTGGHTGLEGRHVGDLGRVQFAEQDHQGGGGEHDAHDGAIAGDRRIADEADVAGDGGGIGHHGHDGGDEDADGELGIRLDLNLAGTAQLDESLGFALQIDFVLIQRLAQQVGDEGPQQTGDEAGRDADGQQGQVVDAKRLQHAGESDHGRRDGGGGDGNLGGNDRDGERTGGANALLLGHFGDHRQGGEGGVTGPGQHGHQVGDDRRGEGDVLGILAQGFFCQVHQIIHPAGQLHTGDGADDGRDDHDHVPREISHQLIARDGHAQPPGQHQYPQTTGKADTYAAYPGPQIDSGEHHK